MFTKIKIAVISLFITSSAALAGPLQLSLTEGVHLEPLDKSELRCMQEALYFEARNQSYEGILAVGFVIMNRVNHSDFPESICAVVHQGGIDGSEPKFNYCQFSYYCDGKPDLPSDNPVEQHAWELSDIYAEIVIRGRLVEDLTNGSTYYHTTYVNPSWSDKFELLASIDSHKFYIHY